MLRRTLLITAVTLSSSAFATAFATPLTRYFPDHVLGVIEAKDLQESVTATGSFGEETQQFLGTLLNEALSSELGQDVGVPGALKDLTVRTMIGSIRDVAAAAYSVNGNPEFLAVVRMTPKNLIVNAFTSSFNDALKRTPSNRKFREGNYLATLDGGMAAGIGNNLFYISSNSDVLKGYFFHFHFPFCPNKQKFSLRFYFFYGVGNCYCRKNMATCSTACYNNAPSAP